MAKPKNKQRAPVQLQPTPVPVASTSPPPTMTNGTPQPDLLAASKANLEVQKLELEVQEKRHAQRWFVSAVRNMKLNEWAVGLAAVCALFVAWTSGLFDATRQNIAAQSERLMVQKIDLEQQRAKIETEIVLKEKELDTLKKRLAPFENEQAALQDLRQFRKKLLAIRLSSTPDYDGIRIAVEGIDADLNFNMLISVPKVRTNTNVTNALRLINRVRTLKGLKLAEVMVTASDVELATEHGELETLVIEHGGIETDVLSRMRSLLKLRSLVLRSNKIRGFERCTSFPSVAYLDVSTNPLGDDALGLLVAAFPNLYGLNLADTQVTDEGLKILVKLQGLGHINLFNTRATGQGALRLLDCPKLESVRISEKVVTEQQRVVMRQQRPHFSGFIFVERQYRWGGV